MFTVEVWYNLRQCATVESGIKEPALGRINSCPVEMHGGNPCGRELWTVVAGLGIDKRPVCLMHSPDRGKDPAKFQEEFKRIIQNAGEGIADFTNFVFPISDYRGTEFKAQCIFHGAEFAGWANFNETKFIQSLDFTAARFREKASFVDVLFEGRTDFYGATFEQGVGFLNATFSDLAHFDQANFQRGANFTGARFKKEASFTLAKFYEIVVFTSAAFERNALFDRARFMRDTVFAGISFEKRADFRDSVFDGSVEFRETVFRDDHTCKPGPIFVSCKFRRPESAAFYKVRLAQALFHRCNVSRFSFSKVDWRRRDGSRKYMLFEEVADLTSAPDLKDIAEGGGRRDYRLIAETYQQLKKNYDGRCDYWTAGDFYYGEMEMKRLSSPRKNPITRWAHRNLGLVAFYKYASEFGESYVLPAGWLLFFMLALFPTLYPLIGLRPTSFPAIPTAAEAVQARRPRIVSYTAYIGSGGRLGTSTGLTIWEVLAISERTSVDVALLRRNLAFRPIGGWGWLAMRTEFALAASLLALFLLALRRQFRR